jgi:hypothetical protein
MSSSTSSGQRHRPKDQVRSTWGILLITNFRMKLKFRGRCHSCRAPLDPFVAVESSFELNQVMTWACLTDVNVVSNDCLYKFTSPQKVVRMCHDCYNLKPKVSLRELILRETQGSKLKIDVPPRKTWNDSEIYEWYKGIPSCPMSWSELPNEFRVVYPSHGFVVKFYTPVTW